MPNIRLDNLPLHRRDQAVGKQAVVNKRDTDPNNVGELSRRHGSERKDVGDQALGIIAEGNLAYYAGSRLIADDDFTFLFNLKWDDLSQSGEYPLLTLRAGIEDANFLQLSLYKLGEVTAFRIAAKGTSTKVEATSNAIQTFSSGGLTFTRSVDTFYLKLNGTTVISTRSFASDPPTGPFHLDLLGTKVGINSFQDKPIVSGTHPIVSNLKYVEQPWAGDASDRTNDGWTLHWKLDGEFSPSFIPSEKDDNALSAIPSAPVVYDGGLRCNGSSGALLIRHTPDMDVFYSSLLNPSSASEFGFHIEGTRNIEEIGRNTKLIDYGGTDGLCLLEILADGKVSFTMNEVTVSTVSSHFGTAAEHTFAIFCGRSLGKLYLRVVVDGVVEEVDSGTANTNTPYLDLNDIPNIYVGSDKSSSGNYRFSGKLTRVAFYPSFFRSDGGASLAVFRLDLTTPKLTDSSPNNRAARLVTHDSRENISPVYSQGGIEDAPFVSVEGGVVLSASGPINYTSKISRQIGSDVTSSRLGQLSFLTSAGTGHVSNREKTNIRSLGIPQPNRLVSQQPLGGGTLKGAYSYGYRFVSDLGTNGPLLRLDPIVAEGDSRIMLGRPRDPNFTALGETYLVCRANTGDVGRLDGDPIASGTDLPVELYARLGEDMDDVDFTESIFHRGAKAEGPNLGFRSESNAVHFDTLDNWTMQSSFKLDNATSTKYTAICGIGPNGNYYPTYNSRGSYKTPDFAAYLSHKTYGSGTHGRLVVFSGRRDKNYWDYWEEGTFGSRHYCEMNFKTTYKALTFTNDDSGWWAPGAYFSIYFVKSGEKLRVYCSRRLDANAQVEWKELTGRTGMTHGVTADNYFSRSHVPAVTRTATGFGFGQLPRVTAQAIPLNSSGTSIGTHGWYRIGQDATPPSSVYIREQGPQSIQYAFRIWEVAKAESDLKSHGEKRFACFPDGPPPLAHKSFIDFAPVVADDEHSTGEFDSGEHSINQERFFVCSLTTRGTATKSEMAAEYPGSLLAPREVPLLLFSDPGKTTREAAAKVFLSDVGDGSLVVEISGDDTSTGNESEGKFSIMEKVWNESTFFSDVSIKRELVPFVNDWHDFNWISFLLRVQPSGSQITNARALLISNLVINGNTVFNSQIGGYDTEGGRVSDWTNGFAWVGNDSKNTEAVDKDLAIETHTGSFRIWSEDQGPDPTDGSQYNYLLGRVSENEYPYMEHYYKFQPGDLNTNLLEDYGSLDQPLVFEDGAALNRDADEEEGVPFPNSSNETIAGIEIFRTSTVGINDVSNNSEVQKALDIARSVDQYFVARIAIGATDFIDSTPDSALGEKANYTSGYIPSGLVSIFVWDDRVVILDDNNRLWPAEPGPFGWESYPSSIRIPNAHGPAIAAINVQGERNQAMVLLLGRSWGTLLTGNPDAPQSHVLGGGVGAESQRCVAHYSGMAFTYNGVLWAIQQGQAVDFGAAVQELLPDPVNTRLATSAKLSSLFVIDESTGDALRFHFPTKQWTVEDRGATAAGDLESGNDAWINKAGSWSEGNEAVFGDDVFENTPPLFTCYNQPGTLTKFDGTGLTQPDLTEALEIGMRVTIVATSGSILGEAVETEVVSFTGNSVTLAEGTSVAVYAKLYFGTRSDGLLIDTGPMDLGADNTVSPQILVDNLTGTGWEYAVYATNNPGNRGELPDDLTFNDLRSGPGARASGLRGRFQRVVVRNRKREQAQIPLLEIKIN